MPWLKSVVSETGYQTSQPRTRVPGRTVLIPQVSVFTVTPHRHGCLRLFVEHARRNCRLAGRRLAGLGTSVSQDY